MNSDTALRLVEQSCAQLQAAEAALLEPAVVGQAPLAELLDRAMADLVGAEQAVRGLRQSPANGLQLVERDMLDQACARARNATGQGDGDGRTGRVVLDIVRQHGAPRRGVHAEWRCALAGGDAVAAGQLRLMGRQERRAAWAI